MQLLHPRLLLHFFHIQMCKYTVLYKLLNNASISKHCYKLQIHDSCLT